MAIFAKEFNPNDYVECPYCGGRGSLYDYDADSLMVTRYECIVCAGLGLVKYKNDNGHSTADPPRVDTVTASLHGDACS